jgi:hypothetical protein
MCTLFSKNADESPLASAWRCKAARSSPFKYLREKNASLHAPPPTESTANIGLEEVSEEHSCRARDVGDLLAQGWVFWDLGNGGCSREALVGVVDGWRMENVPKQAGVCGRGESKGRDFRRGHGRRRPLVAYTFA